MQLGLLVFLTGRLSAAYFNWQEYHGNGLGGGTIGNGTLQMSNTISTVRGVFTKGPGTFGDSLVIFVDTVPGGLTTTANLYNNANRMEIGVSGYKTSRSVATFAPGFGADYAIVLGINDYTGVYKLVDDPGGPYIQQVRAPIYVNPKDNGNLPSYYFTFDWTDIGLTAANTNFFKFESTYVTSNGGRSLDSFEGLTGTAGFGSITFTNYDTYGVEPIPENANTALAIFGGIVLSAVLIKQARGASRSNQRQISVN